MTNMASMFASTPFNQDIGNWDVSNVISMRYMFQSCESFNERIFNWDVSSVTDMSGMFAFASNFNQDLSSWNVTNVLDYGGFLLVHPAGLYLNLIFKLTHFKIF